jgi:hypothetical protein
MYYGIVAAFMLVFPVLSIFMEAIGYNTSFTADLVGKWFVFWSVGGRLLLAGLRQILQPAYTAKVILGLQGDEALLLVRELGFSNTAIGAAGVVSLFVPAWRMAIVLIGTLFYLLAGVNHLFQPKRNRVETVAMVSDLFVGIVLLGVGVWSVFSQ